MVFIRQLPPPEHSRGSGGSGEPIKALGKLQDRFPRAGIGQLPSHLARLLGAVEPLSKASFKIDGIWSSLNSFLSLLLSLSNLRLRYQGHTEPNAETTSHTAPQRLIDRNSTNDEPYSWGEPWDRIACRCIWVKSQRTTAFRNSGVVR